MKRVALIAALMLASAGVYAQDCETLVLPFFGGNADKMAQYPAEKLAYRCQYARNAFYWSDTIPAGATVMAISQVRNKETNAFLAENVNIDLSTFSYYAYSFADLQNSQATPYVTFCFSTPGSAHPYLVLRSLDETYFRTEFPERYNQ